MEVATRQTKRIDSTQPTNSQTEPIRISQADEHLVKLAAKRRAKQPPSQPISKKRRKQTFSPTERDRRGARAFPSLYEVWTLSFAMILHHSEKVEYLPFKPSWPVGIAWPRPPPIANSFCGRMVVMRTTCQWETISVSFG